MKRFFIVTYWASFESDKNTKHDRFKGFWVWKAPQFIDWIVETRDGIEKNNNCNLVVVNCGKV